MVVIFCSVVRRSNPRDIDEHQFAELAAQFNQQLKERTDGIRTLYFYHDRLHRHLGADGVHLNHKGNRRLFHSFKSAIYAGLRALPNDANRVVYSGPVYTSFE